MTDISAFGFDDDVSFTKYLVKEIGVAAVPGSSFYRDARDGARQVRFAFCKKVETLDAAAEKLEKLRAREVSEIRWLTASVAGIRLDSWRVIHDRPVGIAR